jgi:hypothetical protein
MYRNPFTKQPVDAGGCLVDVAGAGAGYPAGGSAGFPIQGTMGQAAMFGSPVGPTMQGVITNPGAEISIPEQFINQCQTYQNCLTPLDFTRDIDPTDPSTLEFEIAPRNGAYLILGVQTLTAPNEVFFTQFITGGGDDNKLASQRLDVAAFNTDETFSPLDWGCISPETPAQVRVVLGSAASPTAPTILNGRFFGVHRKNINACYNAAAQLGCLPPNVAIALRRLMLGK